MPNPVNGSSPEPMLQFFQFDGPLPPPLKTIMVAYRDLATHMVEVLPRSPERTVMLRKLIESRDCAVRAILYPV